MAQDSIKVIALQTGFYGGNRVREGQEFFVGAKEKAKWYAPVNSDVAAPARATKAEKEGKDQVLNRPVALSELGKGAPQSFLESVASKKKAEDAAKAEKAGKKADDKKADDLA